MKKYEPKELVAISRYQNFFPTRDESIQNDIYARMKQEKLSKTGISRFNVLLFSN